MELLLFYQNKAESPGVHMQSRLAQLPLRERVEVFRSIGGLAARLWRPAVNLLIVILLAANRQELEELLAIRHLLGKARVFLMIADEEEETIALAHRLRPRYLGYLGGDFTELALVLGKLIKEHQGEGGVSTNSCRS
jgi:hypothetical protein